MQKKKVFFSKNILFVTLASVLALFFLFGFTLFSFAAWTSRGSSKIFKTGEWRMSREPSAISFDDVAAALTAADPFLLHGNNRIHILGVVGLDIVPRELRQPLEAFDVLLYEYQNDIIIVQLTAQVDGNIFVSWQSFLDALADNTIATHTVSQFRRFRQGNIYTRAHAPVLHGANLWLARHDHVLDAPEIHGGVLTSRTQSDWFLISNSWVAQPYPVGWIVEHNGRHYRMAHDTNASIEPTPSAVVWQELSYIDMSSLQSPYWISRPWGLFDVVSYEGEFFVSLQDNNTVRPGVGQNWQVIREFDVGYIVPEYDSTAPDWQQRRFVKRTVDGEQEFWFAHNEEWMQPLDNINAWTRVKNFEHLVGVEPWSATSRYLTHGVLVEHEGHIFLREGQNHIVGVSPFLQGGAWARILTWQETQRPIEFNVGNWSGNRIFQVTAHDGTREYYALVSDTWTTNTVMPWHDNNRHFRKIERWDQNTDYHFIGDLPWGAPINAVSHAYIEDEETGEITFWEVGIRPPSAFLNGGMAGGNLLEISKTGQDSPFWRRHAFHVPDTMLVTVVGGKNVVWQRNAGTSSTPRPPSIENNDWIRRQFAVADTHVYTEHNGTVTLWERQGNRATTQAPGMSNDWQVVPFMTGIEFVYTVTKSGKYSFWHSPSQSSESPSLDIGRPMSERAWILLNPIDIRQGYYYTRAEDGGTLYYNIRQDGNWNLIQNAWVGTHADDNTTQNHWNPQSTYAAGDIVVYGTTLTDKYRYFVLSRAGQGSAGHTPMSPNGMLFWQRVR